MWKFPGRAGADLGTVERLLVLEHTVNGVAPAAARMASGSAAHNLTFSYDRYGNMTRVTNQQTQGPCPSYTFNSSTNRITNTGFTYDPAGNLTADGTGAGTHTYQWDAENRITSIDSGTTASYTYNALGQRVEKKVGSAYTEFMFDASREPVGEHNRTSWSVSAVRFQGLHLAHYQNNATYFLHSNRLGSTAQATDYSGAMAQDQLFYPWGQSWSMVGSTQEARFASLQHRDTTETGLDPTQFRMFSSTQGRWFSTDPVRGRAHDPQSLNLYSYVRNSPTSLTDPKGNCWWGWGFCDPWLDPWCGLLRSLVRSLVRLRVLRLLRLLWLRLWRGHDPMPAVVRGHVWRRPACAPPCGA